MSTKQTRKTAAQPLAPPTKGAHHRIARLLREGTAEEPEATPTENARLLEALNRLNAVAEHMTNGPLGM